MNDTDRKKERLAIALRENLKKRKIQQHARIKNTLIPSNQDIDNEKKDLSSATIINNNKNPE